MQEAVHIASEEASRREREAADRRVVAAEKDVLLQSQMCALSHCYRPAPVYSRRTIFAQSAQQALSTAEAVLLHSCISIVQTAPAAGECRRRRKGMKRRGALCAIGWLTRLPGNLGLGMTNSLGPAPALPDSFNVVRLFAQLQRTAQAQHSCSLAARLLAVRPCLAKMGNSSDAACRQHELEMRKDKADVELLKMQQGLSATLNMAPLPEKAEASSGNRAPSEAMAVLEQRLQLAQEESAQLRETIVKQVPLHWVHTTTWETPGGSALGKHGRQAPVIRLSSFSILARHAQSSIVCLYQMHVSGLLEKYHRTSVSGSCLHALELPRSRTPVLLHGLQ